MKRELAKAPSPKRNGKNLHIPFFLRLFPKKKEEGGGFFYRGIGGGTAARLTACHPTPLLLARPKWNKGLGRKEKKLGFIQNYSLEGASEETT